jgi:altronate hydrolase
VPAKHKLAVRPLVAGERLKMYGITVAEARRPIVAGEWLTPQNIAHVTDPPTTGRRAAPWQPPDVSHWRHRRFDGYHRANGSVGTRNYWVVLPLVFCENRNVRTMRDAMLAQLGYVQPSRYAEQAAQLVAEFRAGASSQAILADELVAAPLGSPAERVFPNVDGVRFLTHAEGCGASDQEGRALCGLLAGCVTHPNVAGATVLSLGCQKSQVALLEMEIHRRDPQFTKPLYIFEQQKIGTEESLLSQAIKHTFAGLIEADQLRREPAPLAHLRLGVECGGSDGFSGITANPAIGHCSDLLVALGGSVILSEFPELAGCESDLAARCTNAVIAERFLQLMHDYEAHLRREGNSFDSNPSPGNIREGLTTVAIKSAGAARKGGTSPVVDVLDYPEWTTCPGLSLLCTPGGDVESTTAMAGAGATVMLFSTGLGTPTGNVISPVLKVSSNSELAHRMHDIIDIDAGEILGGQESIESLGQKMLESVIRTASGQYQTKAERLGQEDFIPWRRTLSL